MWCPASSWKCGQNSSWSQQSQALEKILRSNPCPAPKESMKVELTQSSLLGELCQIRLLNVVLVEIANHVSDSLVIVHAPIFLTAARHFHPILAAGSDTGGPRVFAKNAPPVARIA